MKQFKKMTENKSNLSFVEKSKEAIFDIISKVPASQEVPTLDPQASIDQLATKASWKAAGIAGALALPLGPFGMLTILPDLIVVWRIQTQLISDIAALHGKSANLGREEMLYCLFQHNATQTFQDVIVRVGERFLVRRARLKVLQNIIERVGYRISQRLLGQTLSRWLPFIGAAGVAWYAQQDTRKVANNARDFFSREIQVEESH